MVASHAPPSRDLAHNPGVCPDQELKWLPFSLQNNAQRTEAHQSGLRAKNSLLFLKILFIFRERGEEGEREREKHQCVVASHRPPTGDPAHNPGMCPDWELNRQPFGLQDGTQSAESPHPELIAKNYLTSSPSFLALHGRK